MLYNRELDSARGVSVSVLSSAHAIIDSLKSYLRPKIAGFIIENYTGPYKQVTGANLQCFKGDPSSATQTVYGIGNFRRIARNV